MPKRQGALFDKMFSLDALYTAYRAARKGKRKKRPVREFERNLGANIVALHEELVSGFYKTRPYKVFTVKDPKPRLIFAPHFRDVVVQHAMYRVLYPIMDKTFHFESFGCRLGKGTHRAADHAQESLRRSPPDSYLVQFDIRKFFYRIDRGILLSLWARKIKDSRVLSLIGLFVDYPDPTGIPIGNLLSQLSALVYLHPLDDFIKRQLKAPLYVRYVDDFIIFGVTREKAREYKRSVEDWLADNLRLELSKWTIQATRRGVNFVGFRTWRRTRFVRKRAMFNFRKALKAGKESSVSSCLSHALRTASHRHFVRQIQEARLCS